MESRERPKVAPRSFLDRFSRITSGGRFIPQIDGLRFVAISTVVLFHVEMYVYLNLFGQQGGGELHRVVGVWSYGVQLFFAISGFILCVPFAASYLGKGRCVRLTSYFKRRLTRLEPPYLLNLLIVFPLVILHHHYTLRMLLPHLLASAVYLHNAVYGSLSLVNGVSWSLEIEVQFYVLAPLLAQVFRIRRKTPRRAVIIALMLGACFAQALWGSMHLWLSLAGQLQYFLAGFLLADFYLTDWDSQPRTSLSWDAVSLVGWPLLGLLCVRGWHTALIFPFLALAVYCAAFRGRISSGFFRVPIITTIGGMCYSIYLFHDVVINVLAYLVHPRRLSSFPLTVALSAVLMVPVVLAVCALYFVLIERPCMARDWPQRLRARVRELTMGRRALAPGAPVGAVAGADIEGRAES